MPTISAPFVWRAPSSTQPRNRPRVICSECGGRVGPHAYLTILDAYRGSPRPVIMCDATDVAHDPSGSYSLELHAGNPADTAELAVASGHERLGTRHPRRVRGSHRYMVGIDEHPAWRKAMNHTETRMIAAIDRRRTRPRPADELRRPDRMEPSIPLSARDAAERAWRAITSPTTNQETKP